MLYDIVHDKAEEAKTRGTPVTRESFLAWKVKFDREIATKRAKEQGERLKNLTPKEREEHKKFQGRPTGTIIYLGLWKSQLKRFQANRYLNMAGIGLRMNRLKMAELRSMSPSMNALKRWKRETRETVYISVTAIRDDGNAWE